jgi:hypothetical protein
MKIKYTNYALNARLKENEERLNKRLRWFFPNKINFEEVNDNVIIITTIDGGGVYYYNEIYKYIYFYCYGFYVFYFCKANKNN